MPHAFPGPQQSAYCDARTRNTDKPYSDFEAIGWPYTRNLWIAYTLWSVGSCGRCVLLADVKQLLQLAKEHSMPLVYLPSMLKI